MRKTVGYSVAVRVKPGLYQVITSQGSKAAARRYASQIPDARVVRGGKVGRRIYTRNPVTWRKARTILHHGKVRGRKLTEKQRRYFGARASGYRVRNPKKKLVLIYGAVLSIDAQKTQVHQCDGKCKQYKHRYRHVFRTRPNMYGLKNGDILITSRTL